MGLLLLVTGGARSGKSRYAVDRARLWGPHVLYVATCQPEDDEMRERVRQHRTERPETWTTVEPGHNVLAAIRDDGPRSDGILLDCLTLHVARLLVSGCGEIEVVQQAEDLCLALRAVSRPSAIVTNEVGWGVVPETPLGRLFRDAAGRANQVAARYAQEVVLLVCGLPVVVKDNRR
ncbi:MAG: bifunctional adenosylcobinamide kinase/adenosylcobinamide-phosphate guanylyltransferase [Nitrospinae bacterium]|nr:bifunctional adenosylcobinamide kinase/adenosylcobinamide-phosphate guanylyltransferase [Nitrospinota bacterium]